MKKIIFGLLSFIVFFSPVFSYDFFVGSSGGNNYLCYYNYSNDWNSSNRSYTYYVSPFFCGSITENHNFNESFQINTISSPFTISNVNSTSAYSLRFFSNGLKFSNRVDYLNNSSRYYSFPTSSLTNNISYPGESFQHQLVYVNFNLGSFLVFDGNNIAGSLYNNYFFTGYNYFSNSSSYFYNIDISTSSSFVSGNSVDFVSIFDDGFSTNNSGKIINMNSKIDGVLLVPLMDYGFDYLTGSHTLLMKFINGQLVYNIFDCFSSQSSVLKNCNVVDRGYFNDLSFFNRSGYSFNFTPSFTSEYINKNYKFGFYSGNIITLFGVQGYNYSSSDYSDFITSYKSFELTSNSSAPDILSTVKFPITSGEVVDVLVSICNQSVVKPPYCENGGLVDLSGDLEGMWYVDLSGNLVYTIIGTDPENLGSFDLVPNGSGGFNVVCTDDFFGCSLSENLGLSGATIGGSSGFILSSDYYEKFFTHTGYWGKCPYPYVDLNVGLHSKFLNKIGDKLGFDVFLPINCSVAAFYHGKNYKFLSDVNLGLSPLMGEIQGSNDPRVYLYRFFDFLLSFALIVFLLKIYHLLN